MLHCKHLNERLEFGMESVAILSHAFINNGGKIIPCRTAIVDLGLNEVDPGLAPDGAKCAPGKVIHGLFLKVGRNVCHVANVPGKLVVTLDVRESKVHAGGRFACFRIRRESVSQ